MNTIKIHQIISQGSIVLAISENGEIYETLLGRAGIILDKEEGRLMIELPGDRTIWKRLHRGTGTVHALKRA